MDRRRDETGFIKNSALLPSECTKCRWLALCRNGCRRYRDEDGKSVFCEAYKEFFKHAFVRLRELVG